MASIRDLDLSALAGMPADEARAIIAAAGGQTRVVEPGGSVTMDYRPDRVTLVVADGRVVSTPAIG